MVVVDTINCVAGSLNGRSGDVEKAVVDDAQRPVAVTASIVVVFIMIFPLMSSQVGITVEGKKSILQVV